MKFENKQLLPEEIKIQAQKQIEKKKTLFMSTVRHRGHTMYEINCTTGEINVAKYLNERVELVADIDLITGFKKGVVPKTVRDVECKENCLYISALNKASALKKYFEYIAKNAIKG